MKSCSTVVEVRGVREFASPNDGSSRNRRVKVLMLDLNDVRVFTVVARRGTFSAAGRELRLPTSTVARSTTRLEKHLEVLLLRRSPRGVSLTDAGTEFLVSCNQALRTIRIGSETLQERRVNPRGLIRVSSPIVLANGLLVCCPRDT